MDPGSYPPIVGGRRKPGKSTRPRFLAICGHHSLGAKLLMDTHLMPTVCCADSIVGGALVVAASPMKLLSCRFSKQESLGFGARLEFRIPFSPGGHSMSSGRDLGTR